ncbi:MAG: 4Fe-4S dicluster domain-containing protein [Candidatus Lokiarchaeota archaeon]|nr:4Fe-4S dicluster domain-containing protein [Candidatus Lokiarchaeota archaeon]
MESVNIIINQSNCTGCRVCQLICSFLYHNEFNPSKANIQIIEEYELTPIIKFMTQCNHCGQCARNCLYDALKLEVDDTK